MALGSRLALGLAVALVFRGAALRVGFAGLHNKGRGVFDTPHRGITATAFIPVGLPDLAELLRLVTALDFSQRVFQTDVL